MNRVLITGSAGLIGQELRRQLEQQGFSVVGLDIRADPRSSEFADIRNAEQVRARIAGCVGVVHLAAISRVIWGEQHPERCWDVNVGGAGIVLHEAIRGRQQYAPWFVYASSREVYGQAETFPVSEDCMAAPMNVYGKAKLKAEHMVGEASAAGLVTSIIRLSNVFGSTDDHIDRVAPAFARAAALGGTIFIEGRDNMFDFTCIKEVAAGIVLVAKQIHESRRSLPTVHLVSGKGTTLWELAQIAVEAGNPSTVIEERPARNFDVPRFIGNPKHAEKLLGWRHSSTVAEGMRGLTDAFVRREAEKAGQAL